MALGYPKLSFAVRQRLDGEVGVWTGVVQPVRSLQGLDDILDDLAHDRVVRVVGGEVRHHPDCRASHCRHDWMRRLVYWRIAFELEVRYSGNSADPRCWVRAPPVATLHKRKHVWNDGSICPFLSSEGWDADHDDVVDFMGHVAIWLVKWMLWDQTGVWIGGEHGTGPQFHLSTLRAADPCWCRSGRPYRFCHRQGDRLAARRTPRPARRLGSPAQSEAEG